MRNRLAALMACALLLAGCGSTPAVNYYVLSAAKAPAGGAPGFGDKVVGLGPVSLAEYLDRPQIVTRTSANTLEVADAHRWAQPLDESIKRALQENLCTALGTENILAHPWPRSRGVDYQVAVEVLRFEREPGGAVALSARWSVLDRHGATLAPVRHSNIATPSSGPGYEALVSDQSRALALLGREIAAALRNLE